MLVREYLLIMGFFLFVGQYIPPHFRQYLPVRRRPEMMVLVDEANNKLDQITITTKLLDWTQGVEIVPRE